jgi:hypothetical protein
MFAKNSDNFSIRENFLRDIYNYENAFYWLSHPSRISKLLAQYELYQKIIDIPGDIIEIGVYKAASLIRFATFRQTLENDSARKIIGFDAFGAFPRENISLPSDRDFIENFERNGGEGLSAEEVTSIIDHKGFKNIHLVPGNIFNTLEIYLDKFPSTRISMLHLDVDVKEPTQYALEKLYERIVPNGLVVIDDYGLVEGATEAIEYFAKKNKLNIQKTTHYTIPAYIKKPSY